MLTTLTNRRPLTGPAYMTHNNYSQLPHKILPSITAAKTAYHNTASQRKPSFSPSMTDDLHQNTKLMQRLANISSDDKQYTSVTSDTSSSRLFDNNNLRKTSQSTFQRSTDPTESLHQHRGDQSIFILFHPGHGTNYVNKHSVRLFINITK